MAQIGFTHNLFTACEGNRFAQFKIKKLDEYLNYRVYATIRLILRGPNFPQVRQEVIQKGIKWNFWMLEDQTEVNVGFPLSQNTFYQTDWFGDFQIENFYIVYDDPFVDIDQLVISPNTASIVVEDDDRDETVCNSTIFAGENFLLPIS